MTSSITEKHDMYQKPLISECRYAECHMFIDMQIVVMLSAVMLSVMAPPW
jgi:hypothetical protein